MFSDLPGILKAARGAGDERHVTIFYRPEHAVEGVGLTESAAIASYAKLRARMERDGIEVVPPEMHPKLERYLLDDIPVGWRFGLGRVRVRCRET